MLHCGECEKYMKFGDDGKHGVCSLPECYFPVTAEDECHYLSDRPITCKMCSHFSVDAACMTAEADDNATNCCGFHDKREDDICQVFIEWLQEGGYSRQRINNLCVEFEQSDIYKFINTHVQHCNGANNAHETI